MITDLTVPALLAGAVFIVLIAVHLWSSDAGRRERARRLLQTLFRI